MKCSTHDFVARISMTGDPRQECRASHSAQPGVQIHPDPTDLAQRAEKRPMECQKHDVKIPKELITVRGAGGADRRAADASFALALVARTFGVHLRLRRHVGAHVRVVPVLGRDVLR